MLHLLCLQTNLGRIDASACASLLMTGSKQSNIALGEAESVVILEVTSATMRLVGTTLNEVWSACPDRSRATTCRDCSPVLARASSSRRIEAKYAVDITCLCGHPLSIVPVFA